MQKTGRGRTNLLFKHMLEECLKKKMNEWINKLEMVTQNYQVIDFSLKYCCYVSDITRSLVRRTTREKCTSGLPVRLGGGGSLGVNMRIIIPPF